LVRPHKGKKKKIKNVDVAGKAAIRSLRAAGMDVSGIKDCTPMPHNGCRQKKRRRI
jgi:small subunit ribosomal protein S11